jgi:hypothetical protein
VISNPNPKGVITNFEHCLSRSQGDYVFLSDQDDVWLPTKIADFQAYTELNKISPDSIALIYSDLEIVNSALECITSSYLQSKKNPHKLSKAKQLQRLILRNWVPGCSTMVTKKLKELALPFPMHIHMHDHWLSLLALCYGNLFCIEKPLIKYRQHSSNLIGTKNRVWESFNGTKVKRLLQKLNQAEHVALRSSRTSSGSPLKEILIKAPNPYLRNFFRMMHKST